MEWITSHQMDVNAFRSLTSTEIDILSRGNDCLDWSTQILIAVGCTDSAFTLSRIKRCSFHGTVYISFFDDVQLSPKCHSGLLIPQGLYDTAFYGICHLSPSCHVSKTTAMNNVFVGNRSVVLGCGVVSSEGGSAMASLGSLTIHVGPETGGRALALRAGMHYADICNQLFEKSAMTTASSIDVNHPSPPPMTIVGHASCLSQCDTIFNCQIALHATVTGSSLDHCVLISSESHPVTVSLGAKLSHCVLHEACTATNGCVAEHVFLCEHSSLGDMARVAQSVLAPDSSVAGGECHHSLLGPFVGFHHQSLLIAAVWPLGRGNVAYGANVGANHTGRVNDQECWPGEGVFFGLGSLVKFPCNLLESPYSILVPGTVLSPQKISYPFSLISAGPGDRMECSSIKPGWVLYGNPYMVDRAMKKFSGRRKARDHSTDFNILRPSVVDMVRSARRRLSEASSSTSSSSSSSSCSSSSSSAAAAAASVAAEGLGLCLLSSKDAQRGLAAYKDCIHAYALQGVLHVLETAQMHSPPAMATVMEIVREMASQPLAPATAASSLQRDIQLFRIAPSSSSSSCPLPSQYITTASHDAATLTHQLGVFAEEFPLAARQLPEAIVALSTTTTTTTTTTTAAAAVADSSPSSRSQQQRCVDAVCDVLKRLTVLASSHASAVQNCRSRDAQKGQTIFHDYGTVNAVAEDVTKDPVVQEALARAENLSLAVQRIVLALTCILNN